MVGLANINLAISGGEITVKHRCLIKNIISIVTLLLVMVWQSDGSLAESTDMIVFTQVNNGVKTLYIADKKGTVLKPVFTGKDIEVFIEKGHLFYFGDQQLFHYDLSSNKGQKIARFEETNFYMQSFMGDTNQALIVAKSLTQINYYVLDFKDWNLRRVPRLQNLYTNNSGRRKISMISPDDQKRVTVNYAGRSRFEIFIEKKVGSGYKTSWKLPKEMTVLPELPVWSPDSNYILFYSKKFDGYEGFYSLYLLNINDSSLKVIEEQVLIKDLFSGFGSGGYKPDWSKDGKYILFGYLPSGSPTQNVIIKYEVLTGKKEILINNPGINQFPRWAPSGERILFLSDRENHQLQLYSADAEGRDLKRISPSEGFTDQAAWVTF